MVGKIIRGVCSELQAEFPDVMVYTREAQRKDGVLNPNTKLREPNFFVSCRNPSSRRVKDRYFTQTPLLGNRYLLSATLCVECRWFPDWEDVLDRLFACLEYIRFGDDTVVRGRSMQGEYADDALNFFVTYEVFTCYEEVKPVMEKIVTGNVFVLGDKHRER